MKIRIELSAAEVKKVVNSGFRIYKNRNDEGGRIYVGDPILAVDLINKISDQKNLAKG